MASITPPEQLPPFLRLPMEIKEAIVDHVILFHKEDGTPGVVTVSTIKWVRKRLFAITNITKEFYHAFATRSLQHHIFRLQATDLQHMDSDSTLFSTIKVNNRVLKYGLELVDSRTSFGDYKRNARFWPHWYCFRMELPPMATRQHINQLEMILRPPTPNDDSAGLLSSAETMMERARTYDWLYPVRELKGALGFTNVKSLTVRIDLKPWRFLHKEQYAEDVRKWVREQIDRMETAVENLLIA